MRKSCGMCPLQGSPAGYLTALVIFLYGAVTLSGVKAQTKRTPELHDEIMTTACSIALACSGQDTCLNLPHKRGYLNTESKI
ncbi:hypothetical protein PoB_002402500 [Plakobranchus ocellatus]|uniref:Uncharacterized protein n=1 Tax=Plakobranchus ocellatus TaxID=259542 RepID=A0AAV3ZP74_9GAST|nr:hypothetical protein PoB_002402500 [Plakobranchus ocellatus]